MGRRGRQWLRRKLSGLPIQRIIKYREAVGTVIKDRLDALTEAKVLVSQGIVSAMLRYFQRASNWESYTTERTLEAGVLRAEIKYAEAREKYFSAFIEFAETYGDLIVFKDAEVDNAKEQLRENREELHELKSHLANRVHRLRLRKKYWRQNFGRLIKRIEQD